MQKITYIWTSWNGKKTPITLMDDQYLRNCYIRCLEVVCAETFREKLFENNKTNYGKDFNGAGYTILEMKSEFIDLEKATKWLERFKEEMERRKLPLPKLDRTNIDFQYKAKQFRKEHRKESNKKFDQDYWKTKSIK